MDTNDTSRIPFNLSGNTSMHLNDHTVTPNPIYVFTPAGYTGKVILCLIVSTIGVLGFLGNCFIFYFLGHKPRNNRIQSNRFVVNLNLYIRSLSLSDLLSCAVAIPLSCIQILLDVFQSGWSCKAVRYAQFTFPVITLNTLVVISLEKYLSTRFVLRTFRTSNMRKMIICAWAFGLIFMLFASAPYNGIRVDLNNTHFTIICKYDEQFYPFKITLIVLPIQYVLPCGFVTFVNISLMKTIWGSGRRQIANAANNNFQAQLRAKKIRGTTLLIALTFSFVIPFFFFLGNLAYTQILKPRRVFSLAYMMRYGSGCIVWLSPLMNFIIYFAQMKDFRVFLKKLLCKRNNKNHQHRIVARKRANCFVLKIKNPAGKLDSGLELTQFQSASST